jgi:hypothetical protein
LFPRLGCFPKIYRMDKPVAASPSKIPLPGSADRRNDWLVTRRSAPKGKATQGPKNFIRRKMSGRSPSPQHLRRHFRSFGQEKKRPGETRTIVTIFLTGTMMAVEIAAGVLFGSIALMAHGMRMASHAVHPLP